MVKIKEYMIKRILIYHLLCMLTSSVAYGQTTIIKRQSTTAKKIGGRFGYIDKTGKIVIPCKYYDAVKYSEGLACVVDGGSWS